MFKKLKIKLEQMPLNMKYKNKYSTTYKGQYLIKYLLDVYINNIKNDYIEAYEKPIDLSLQRMEKSDMFLRMEQMSNQKISDKEKREHAAANLFGILCYVLNKEEQEYYLKQISQPVVRIFIETFYLHQELTDKKLQEIREV